MVARLLSGDKDSRHCQQTTQSQDTKHLVRHGTGENSEAVPSIMAQMRGVKMLFILLYPGLRYCYHDLQTLSVTFSPISLESWGKERE